MNKYRSHNCFELREQDIGKKAHNRGTDGLGRQDDIRQCKAIERSIPFNVARRRSNIGNVFGKRFDPCEHCYWQGAKPKHQPPCRIGRIPRPILTQPPAYRRPKPRKSMGLNIRTTQHLPSLTKTGMHSAPILAETRRRAIAP